MPRRLDRKSLPRITAGAAVLTYCWWASGAHPFTWAAYVAVGLPFGVVVLLALRELPFPGAFRAREGEDRTASFTLRSTYPWILLAIAASALEAAGLALGGRSAAVPTISTLVDHVLAWHVVRFALFAAWLAACLVPLARSSQVGPPGAS